MSGKSNAMALLVLCLSASAPACGDPRDIQVPLIPETNPMVVPELARAPVQAFASVGIQGAEGGDAEPCPLNVVLALGSSCDRIASGGATCGSLREGDGIVQCSVRPGADAPSVFDVDLLFEHRLLPKFSVMGSMSDMEMLPVTLQVATLEEDTLDAQCLAEATVARPGVVQFRLDSCVGQVNGMEAAGCEVNISAGFENCQR
jgi:hypothetical protein